MAKGYTRRCGLVRKPRVKKKIYSNKSGRTIPSRQNYRVILQSGHNLRAWPRAAWVGASCSKWSLPA
jgi:hypothetical protein